MSTKQDHRSILKDSGSRKSSFSSDQENDSRRSSLASTRSGSPSGMRGFYRIKIMLENLIEYKF